MTAKPAGSVSVVIPTYRRPDVLGGCVSALHRQETPPLEVLVCYRSNDGLTADLLDSLPEEDTRLLRRIVVGEEDNLAASLSAGIAAAQGEFVALTDDDAEAPPEWIERLASAFADDLVAGVGGRDAQEGKPPSVDDVGRVQWFGRRIANHSIGRGPARDIDVLKGVNCCFRKDLFASPAIDERLRGAGNVAHWELALCLPLVRAGWRLVYDPTIVVQHHIAPRKDGDVNQRGGFAPKALTDFVHNETLMVLEHLTPIGRVAFGVWSLLIGTHFTPGVAGALRITLRDRDPFTAAHRFWVTQCGRLQGLLSWTTAGRTRPDHLPSAATP